MLRHDPMAMIPFCGYNMADYFAHWLEIGKRLTQPPRIFHVNWFRKGRHGGMLWPGFGDNIRVLKWILERVEGRVPARESAIGVLPHAEDIDCSGLGLSQARLLELLEVDASAWLNDARRTAEFLERFGERLPRRIQVEHRSLMTRLREYQARKPTRSQGRARSS